MEALHMSFLVHGLEQARTKDAVHAERGSNCFMGKLVQVFVRVMALSFGGFGDLGASRSDAFLVK